MKQFSTEHVKCFGTGLGLRPVHYPHILQHSNSVKSSIPWFEAISENYMGTESGSGGAPIQTLEKIRTHHPIVLHGVSMSLGSVDPLNFDYLKKLKTLIHRIEPEWISDHLCWTGVMGENLHDLLPLPYTGEALDHLAERILYVQDFLGRRMLVENVSAYLNFKHSEMKEWEFLRELSIKADCGLLLDVNNIHVSAKNQGFNPHDFLDGIPPERVGQMHLAGYSIQNELLIDTHDHPVSNEVWTLYRAAVKRFGAIPTLIEWDASIPKFEVLEGEAIKANQIQKEVLNEAR